jgi:hypothetical protein
MNAFTRLYAGIAKLGSPQFQRRLRRRCARYLTRLHDRTAILRDLHRSR